MSPRYVSCIEIPGWSKPPFSFENVTMRVLPLRADVHVLQHLVDRSLNIHPKDARFRVFLPYVYLMLVDYGKMSIDAANLGWIAQHEVTFSIPLEWYAPDRDGTMRFKDWGYYSPFIFVDNALSMTVGRQVYGWPKKLAYFNEEVSNWTKDPRLPANLAGIRTGTYLKLYAGQAPEFRTYLEVEQSSIGSLLGLPLDPRAMWLPWRSLSAALSASMAMASDWADILRGMPLLPSGLRGSLQDARGMISRAARTFDPARQDIAFNTINLKEFRDSEVPGGACYQAITNAQMKVTRFNGAGLLGDLRVLAGDPSGGLVVRLTDYPSLPIVKAMGLKVRSETSFDGARVCALEPVFPFWIDVNLFYDLGTTLVSYPPRRPSSSPRIGTAREPEVAPIAGEAGLSGQEVTGPFAFENAMVRVLPLRAQRDRLQRLLERYLNEPAAGVEGGGLRVEPWGEYVYLVANSYREMASGTNNVGWWAERDLTFYVPVLVYGAPREDGTRPLRTTALVPVLAYADTSSAAFSGAEVYGLPMTRATIESPPTSWMDLGGPADGTARHLLRLRTTVLPVLGLGQPAEERTLLEITGGEVIPSTDPDKRRIASQHWSPFLRDEVRSRYRLDGRDLKVGRVLAAELLSGALPFNVLTLKEFRDCEDPEMACYQSLVNIRYRLQDVLDLREIEEPLHVRVREYPTQPIVETLGLIPRSQDYEDGTVVYNLEALRPFWMRVNLLVSQGQNLQWRTIKRGWTTGVRPWRCYFDPDPPGGPGARAEPADSLEWNAPRDGALAGGVSAELDDALERKSPRDVLFAVREWKARHRAEQHRAFRDDAGRAVLPVGPQAILETVLSREWENRGRTRWAMERERIHDELLRAVKAPDSLIQKLNALDGTLAQIQPDRGRWTTHDRVRQELLGAIRDLTDELQRLRQKLDAGKDSRALQEPLEVVESWFAILQDPLEEMADGELPSQELPGKHLHALAMDVVFWLLRARQKPDFCVRREALLDLVVPPEEVHDGWYVGDKPPPSPGPSAAAAAVPGDGVGQRPVERPGE